MEAIAPKLAEFGVGIFAIGTISYIFWSFLRSHKEEIEAAREERVSNQKWFMEFVNLNNHQKEELIKEHTSALVEVKNAIQQNTLSNKELIEAVLKKN